MAASAKFLEEALSTDVDESAVSAIVGSLETQLVVQQSPSSIGPAAQQTQPQQQLQNHQSNGSSSTAQPVVAAAVSAAALPPTTVAVPALQKQQTQHVANGTGLNADSSNGASAANATSTTTTASSGNTIQQQQQQVQNVTAAVSQEVNAMPTTTSQVVTCAPQSSQTQSQAMQTQQQQQPTFINQVTSNQVTNNRSNQILPVGKIEGDHVKIVYPGPTGRQIIAAMQEHVAANPNNKLTISARDIAHLHNGTLGLVTTQTVSQSTSNAASIVSGTQTTNQATINMNKQTALVIKTSVPGGMVSVPMSVPVTGSANITNTAQQGKAGVTSAIVPSNVQILNVNAMRPGTPVTGQQAGKQVASRVVIGQHMMGGRAGAPGITLQTLQGLQAAAGSQGTLILKTENGQYQLLRVGPAAPGTPAGTVTTPVVATQGAGGTTYRLASLPATVAPTVTTTTVTPVTSTIVAATTTAPTPTATPAQTTPAPTQVKRQATDNTKEKCRKFLANLLELSSREPKHVERNVRTLIQELIDVKVEPEEFCVRLEKLLNASPQPCLIGFLRKSLPLLRQSLVTKELVIEGIRPPPPNVVFSIASAPLATQQNQIRPTVAVAPAAAAAAPAPTQVVASTGTIAVTPTINTQVRVQTPMGVTTIPRPPQPMVQQRLTLEKPVVSTLKKVRPVTTVVRPPATFAVKTATVPATATQQHQQQHHLQQQPIVSTSSGTNTIRQPSGPIVLQKSLPVTTVAKTVTSTLSLSKTVTTKTNNIVVPSGQPKPVLKEKEKKTFSSAGYTGDDDINDVAAMGGVNLAEESQRILGSTKFVGTQIRSCKDEIFLHITPLQQKINKIVTSYGLEEPNQEVASLISHAAQERLKNLVEKLAIIAEHRIDLVKVDPRYEVTQDVRAQLKFLEELDRAERKRHEEQEREVLLKAAKSRAKTEDPEQAKLKAKAKEMQRAEMEEARQREANQTALQAIGPRKKPRLDLGGSSTNSSGGNPSLASGGGGLNRQMPLRPRLKRVNFRDLLFLLEQEKETCRSPTLYRAYLK